MTLKMVQIQEDVYNDLVELRWVNRLPSMSAVIRMLLECYDEATDLEADQ